MPDIKSETAPKNQRIYVNFCQPINKETADVLVTTLSKLLNITQDIELYILFSSEGGSVDVGIYIYNFLKGLPVKKIMHNIGYCQSIANIVFMAGDERHACENSSFLIHGQTWNFFQNTSYDLQQINEVKNMLEDGEEKIDAILVKETKLTKSFIRQCFTEGQSISSAKALEFGIVQNVREYKIDEGCKIITIDPKLAVNL